MRMDTAEGIVPKHQLQLAAELLLQPLDGPEGHAAVGALVVAALDQGDRGVRTAAPVVAVGFTGGMRPSTIGRITSLPIPRRCMQPDSARNRPSAGIVHPPVVSAVTRPRWSHMAGTTTAA